MRGPRDHRIADGKPSRCWSEGDGVLKGAPPAVSFCTADMILFAKHLATVPARTVDSVDETPSKSDRANFTHGPSRQAGRPPGRRRRVGYEHGVQDLGTSGTMSLNSKGACARSLSSTWPERVRTAARSHSQVDPSWAHICTRNRSNTLVRRSAGIRKSQSALGDSGGGGNWAAGVAGMIEVKRASHDRCSRPCIGRHTCNRRSLHRIEPRFQGAVVGEGNGHHQRRWTAAGMPFRVQLQAWQRD